LEKINKKYTLMGDLKRAVESAYLSASEGDNVLFSPGFASFDMFKNYADRGNSFIEVVLGLNSALKLDKK
jgi:UDP-N-acetylmuramoylalanine--D-glutamate ligase